MPLGFDPATIVSIVVFVFGIVVGMAVPMRYGVERLQGLGRWGLSKLPYEPPPGKDAGEAMEDAVDESNQ